MTNRVGNDHVGLRLKLDIMIGGVGGPGAACGHIDHLDLVSEMFAVNEPGEQHRMHFGPVVSPAYNGVARIQVVITT